MEIAALWGAPLCWTAPGWLQPAEYRTDDSSTQAEARSLFPATAQGAARVEREDCHSSDASSQTSSESQQQDAASRSSSECSYENQQDDASKSGSVEVAEVGSCVPKDSGNADASADAEAGSQPGTASPNACDRTFEELDRVFSGGADRLSRGSGARMKAFEVLGAKRLATAAPSAMAVAVKHQKVASGNVAGRGLEPVTKSSEQTAVDRVGNGPHAQVGSGVATGIQRATWGQKDGWEQIAGSNNPVLMRSKLASTSGEGMEHLCNHQECKRDELSLKVFP